MWQKAMDEALELLYSATLDGSVVIGKRRASVVEVRLEHLTCFLPGVLAFGALQGAVDAAKLWFYMDNASKLMETCWRMYERTASGAMTHPMTHKQAALSGSRFLFKHRIRNGLARRSKQQFWWH